MTESPAQTILLTIEGMHCDNCAAKVRAALTQLPGVQEASVDLPAKRARIRFNPAANTTAALMQAVRSAGFQPTGFTRA